jgi:hypothetical protein
MNIAATPTPYRHASFELRFPFLFREGRALAFPCDATGHVDIDGLPRRARENYRKARTLVGREFATPMPRVTAAH